MRDQSLLLVRIIMIVTIVVNMKSVVLYASLSLLTGCVAMPAAPPPAHSDRNGAAGIPSGALLFCTLPAPNTHCGPNTTGLIARGLGGLFLPLDVQITSLILENTSARVALVINNVSGYCSAGTANADTNPPTIKVTGIYCNWLGIGNVVASLELIIDSLSDDVYGAGTVFIL